MIEIHVRFQVNDQVLHRIWQERDDEDLTWPHFRRRVAEKFAEAVQLPVQPPLLECVQRTIALPNHLEAVDG